MPTDKAIAKRQSNRQQEKKTAIVISKSKPPLGKRTPTANRYSQGRTANRKENSNCQLLFVIRNRKKRKNGSLRTYAEINKLFPNSHGDFFDMRENLFLFQSFILILPLKKGNKKEKETFQTMIKKSIRTLLDKWTGDLSNEDFGELVRTLLYYEDNGNIDSIEISQVVRILMNKVFIPKLNSIKKEQNRHKGYYENKKGEKA